MPKFGNPAALPALPKPVPAFPERPLSPRFYPPFHTAVQRPQLQHPAPLPSRVRSPATASMHPAMARGAIPMIVRASASARSINRSAGTTSSTNLIRRASGAPIISPVSNRFSAMGCPTNLGSRWVPPYPGITRASLRAALVELSRWQAAWCRPSPARNLHPTQNR